MPDMVNKQEKLRRKIADLLRKILPCARLQRQADDVCGPSHQIDQIVVSFRHFSNINGNGQPQDRIAFSWHKLGYAVGRIFPVEPKGAGATVELGCIRDTQHRFEAQSKPPDLTRVPLARQVGEHECSDPVLTDRVSVVGAVEMVFRQADQNALAAECVGKRIRTVLDQLEELSMSVTAMSDIMFMVCMFGDEMRLLTVCPERVPRLLRNETANRIIGTGPVGLFDGLRQIQLGIRTIESTALTLGEIILLSHRTDSSSRRSFRLAGRAEMIRVGVLSRA